MNKRYQVFVSSTYSDLKAARLEVIASSSKLRLKQAGLGLIISAENDNDAVAKSLLHDAPSTRSDVFALAEPDTLVSLEFIL